MFQGFSKQSVDFLWQLRFNNNREWFQQHRGEYQALLADPMRELAVQVQGEAEKRFKKQQFNLHISRIQRDARRLFGRGPYKDHLWFTLFRPGAEDTAPAFYFEIGPEQYGMGMGFWQARPADMAKLRARIDRDPAPVEKLGRRLNRQKDYVLEGELYRRPKGEKGKLLDPWYNRKNLSFNRERDCGGSLFTPRLADEILEGMELLMPFYEYLSTLYSDPEPGQQ